MSKINTTLICLFLLLTIGCKHKKITDKQGLEEFSNYQLQQLNLDLTKVIITDILSPPVSSRIYVYCNIAAYEAILPMNRSFKTYAGRLNGLSALPALDKGLEHYSFPIASAIAFNRVAEKLAFNPKQVREIGNNYLRKLDSIGVQNDLLENSIAYGNSIAEHILQWASKDGYLQRTSHTGFITTKEIGRYIPTPPDYMDATEPNWHTLRPFILDSVSQFRPEPPFKYDTAKTSKFYKQALEVYNVTMNPKPEDSVSAWYWDDNPNTSVTQGHFKYFQQKMPPNGHWVHIACDLAKKEELDPVKTAAVISQTAIALADAFIACWDSKYHYNYIRPETFINEYIDKDWTPLIQTPPFPEYVSGHSTISASAAVILTSFFGANYAFVDSTEVPFGRPARRFSSLHKAADEAGISRLYGGIHFRQALEEGNKQGRAIGRLIISKLSDDNRIRSSSK